MYHATMQVMVMNRIIEYVFFFGFMGVVGYLVWLMFAPFIGAVALAAIIVTICYPVYMRIKRILPVKSDSLAALITTLFVIMAVVIPVLLLSSLLLREAVTVYQAVSGSEYSLMTTLEDIETQLSAYVPGVEITFTEYLRQGAEFLARNVGTIFASTASTLFLFFIAVIASFYFFRDGQTFTRTIIEISPLPDDEDELILNRLAGAVRSVATGTVMIALIQGTLTAIGLSIFGFDRAILFGVVAAFGALVPGVGTSIVLLPAIIYLLSTGAITAAVGLTVWAVLAVGLIDNLLGPYLISRGSPMHPFLILLSVLGGIVVFGPIGFVIGPVIVSLFKVLLELYLLHIADRMKEESQV